MTPAVERELLGGRIEMMEKERGEAAVVPTELAAASRLGDEASLGAPPPLSHVRGSAAGAAVEPAALANEPAGPMPPAYPLDFGRRVHRHLSRRGPRGLEPVAAKPVSDARDGATQAVADLATVDACRSVSSPIRSRESPWRRYPSKAARS